jgi:type IV secretory pathway TrbF-like protein
MGRTLHLDLSRRTGGALVTTTTLDPIALPALNGAQREYLEDRAAAVTVGNALKVVAVLLSVLSIGLVGLCVVTVHRYADLKPLVIRIDELGRAQALSYDAASTYTPREPELRYHLREFFQNYLSRERATLVRDYPKALPFLKTYMLGRLDTRETQRILDTFHDTPNADDIQIRVKNIMLSELVAQPFKAGVTFERRTLMPGTDHLRSEPQVVTAQVEFEVLEAAPRWVRDANPLAIAVTNISVFEPFQ